jgi:hypothetical protein
VSGACLLRSSQPMVGITQQTSVNDEILLNACRLSGSIGRHMKQQLLDTQHHQSQNQHQHDHKHEHEQQQQGQDQDKASPSEER